MTSTTVVIPTRDRPDLLRTTLHSVLAASTEARRHGYETSVLVVDDDSPSPATKDLCGELGVGYARIDVHDGQADPASAICLGVSLVQTDFYTLFGDDDIMLTRFVRLHMDRLADGFDLVSGSYALVDANLGSPEHRVLPPPHAGDLLHGKIMVNDGAMVRTSLAQPLPWDPTLGQAVLYPIWLRLLAGGARATTLKETTWLYRRHGANISLSRSNSEAARLKVQQDFREEWAARGLPLPQPTPEVRPSPPRPRAVRPLATAPAPRRLVTRVRTRLAKVIAPPRR
jgi:hypothetical protein